MLHSVLPERCSSEDIRLGVPNCALLFRSSTIIFPVSCPGWKISAVSLSSIPCVVKAVQLVRNSSIPTNLTDDCISAFHSDVNCSPVVAALRTGSYYTEATLNSTCTTDCRTALSAYESRMISACGDQTWNGYEDTVMPVVIIPDMLLYLFNLTCLMDSNRYCNNVASTAALALDPGSMIPSAYGVTFLARSLRFYSRHSRSSKGPDWKETC